MVEISEESPLSSLRFRLVANDFPGIVCILEGD
jgi:hypothetical protein